MPLHQLNKYYIDLFFIFINKTEFYCLKHNLPKTINIKKKKRNIFSNSQKEYPTVQNSKTYVPYTRS